MKVGRLSRLSLIALTALLAASCPRKTERSPIVIVTTPAVAATGIATHLAEVFTSQSGVRSEIRIATPEAVVTGARSGTADVLFVKDADTVASLRAANLVKLANVFANDDFLLVGPRKDPARVRTASSGTQAFHRIYDRRQTFCSPVDVPQIHDRENSIWLTAGLHPKKNRRYRECKGDAAAVLREASRRSAYTLTDRATIDAAEPDHLVTLLKKVPEFDNDLIVVLVQREHPRKDAEWFFQWLTSYRGREAADSYRIGNVKPFYLDR